MERSHISGSDFPEPDRVSTDAIKSAVISNRVKRMLKGTHMMKGCDGNIVNGYYRWDRILKKKTRFHVSQKRVRLLVKGTKVTIYEFRGCPDDSPPANVRRHHLAGWD